MPSLERGSQKNSVGKEYDNPKLPEVRENPEENVPPLPLNGLLYPVDMYDARGKEAFKFVIDKVITELGGVPVTIGFTEVENPYNGALYPRFIFKFHTDHISQEQLEQLEEVARRAYGDDIRTTKTKQGKPSATHLYTKPEARRKEQKTIDTTIGWYFGLDNGIPNRVTKGLFVYRQIGKRDIASGLKARTDGDWFTQKELYDNTGKLYKGSSYLVEIREGGMFLSGNGRVIDGPYATDLAESVVYTSLVLAGIELPPKKPGLIHDIYHEMNQIGLGPATELPGLEEPIEATEKALILPMASPEITRSLKGAPKSVCLIGQVGTGKTQMIKYFLRQNLNITMVPVNAAELENELNQKIEYRTLLPRIRDVADKVGKSILLIVEDIEHLAHKDNPTSKKLINELAGLYNSGYRILSTTNHPEDFNPQLLEPERLGGRLVFCGLPVTKARKLMLEQHLVRVSRFRQLPVFDPLVIGHGSATSDEARNWVLETVAQYTRGFTPRFLKDIVIEAINNLMYRIAKEEGHLDSLKETDLMNHSFIDDDWAYALNEVYKVYDVDARLAEDERLQKIINPGGDGRKNKLGFALPQNTPNQETITTHQLLFSTNNKGTDSE